MVIHHRGAGQEVTEGNWVGAEVHAPELMRLLNRMPPKLIRPLMCRRLCVLSSGSRTHYFVPVTLNTHTVSKRLILRSGPDSVAPAFFFFCFFSFKRHPGDSVSCTSAVGRSGCA